MTTAPGQTALDQLLGRPRRVATVTIPQDPNDVDGPSWTIRLASVGGTRYEALWQQHQTDGHIDAAAWTAAAFAEACRGIVDTATAVEIHLSGDQVVEFIDSLPVNDRTLIGAEIIRLDTEGTAVTSKGDGG